MPRVALPYVAAVGAVEPGAQDPSSAPYVDFFCEYQSTYQLNASAVISLVTPPDGRNYTALGRPQRYLQLPHALDPHPASTYIINLTWSPPCASVGLYPVCARACEGTDAERICSPPACFRMEVRGDCLQGDSVWLAPTPPEYRGNPTLEPLPVLMGGTLQFRVRAGGVAIGERDGVRVKRLVGGLDNGVVPSLGPDRLIAVLNDPGTG